MGGVGRDAERSPLDGILEQRVLTFMTGETKLGPLVIHFEPSEVMRAVMPGFLSHYQSALRHLESRMAMKLTGPFHVFVYDSPEQLQRLSGLPAGGFAAWKVIHVP